MIKIEVNEGNCTVAVNGLALDLLAEIPIGFGRVLYGVLKGFPEGLKQELIKGVFECTLDMMKREAENQ